MRTIVITFIFMAVCWTIFIISFIADRSRYRNCYLLFFALISGIPFIVNISGKYSVQIMIVIADIILLGLLVAPFFLIFNGIVMIKKEGRHLRQLLSLVLGIFILLGEIALTANMIMHSLSYRSDADNVFSPSGLYIAVSLFYMSIVYGSMSVLIFTIYILLLQTIPWKKMNFDYVIILGAGLIDGDKVSKLLSDRLDKAIEVYNRSIPHPKMIPSGGKGSDETISEAEAMKGYLIKKGIPETDIIPEDESTTTFENLTNSKRIIDSREGEKKTALVSSNYHIYRALRNCRKMGFKCTGVGGHVAFYFWPSALIREYIAVHAEKKHLAFFVIGWIICMAFTIGVLMGEIKFF